MDPQADILPDNGAAAEAEVVTIDTVRELARQASAQKSFAAVQKLFIDMGVPKPGQCPPEKLGEAATKLRALMSGL